MQKRFKIVVFVPEPHAAALRKAMGDAGAGRIGAYTHCSFTSSGVGRFRPGAGADPTIGRVGELEEVAEERIEMVCDPQFLDATLRAVRTVHPYEEPAVDIYTIDSP